MYMVVSCDGGGIRGVLTARLLEHLENDSPFLSGVDLFAGTSTGGILALGLAKGLRPSKLVHLYRAFGEKIFAKRDLLDKISNLDELWRADNDHKGLREALESVFDPEETLGDLPKKVLIPAFDLDNQDEESKASATRAYRTRFWKPKFMHNFESPGNDKSVKVVDAALRTSSAPTYFPSYQGYVDGGVVDNNPSMSALAKAVKEGAWLGRQKSLICDVLCFLSTLDDEKAAELVARIRKIIGQEIRLLSLGTGFNPHYISGQEHDFGYKQWVLGTDGVERGALLDMLFDGMIGPPDYMCRQLLNGNYVRLNPNLTEVIGLDAIDRIDELIALADGMDLSKTVDWLQSGMDERLET